MQYLIIIIIVFFISKWINDNTFQWKTVVRHLWKMLYIEADQMCSHMKQFNITDTNDPSLKGFKSQIDLRGKLINSILDYINISNLEETKEIEEETYGYGRYKLETILMFIESNPGVFKKKL